MSKIKIRLGAEVDIPSSLLNKDIYANRHRSQLPAELQDSDFCVRKMKQSPKGSASASERQSPSFYPPTNQPELITKSTHAESFSYLFAILWAINFLSLSSSQHDAQMHPALEIFEIQEHIFRHFYHHGYTTPDLVALACACKTFQEPALDLIWHFDASLRRFLNLFPQDAFVRGGKGEWVRIARPLRPLVPADFERFSFYANRVQHFAFSEDNVWHLNEILEALAPCLPEGCLFPNLRSLNFRHAEVSQIRFFISKKLVQIWNQYRKPCDGMAFIAPVAQTLEFLAINSPFYQGADMDIPVVSALLLKTRQLRVLHTRTIAWDALVHLSNMRSLREMTLGELTFDTQSTTHLGPFSNLENLTFQRVPTLHLFHFLRLLSTPLSTTSFHIGLQDGIAAGSVHIHDTLVEHLDHSAVCDIRLTIGSGLPGERIQTVSSSALLRFACLLQPHLPGAARRPEHHPHRSGPRNLLRLVTRQASDDPEDRPKLPLKALQRFAKHCPHLHTLELMFDTTHPPAVPEDEDAIQTTLTELRVSFSPVADCNKSSVARYLFHLFPNIATMFHKRNFMIHILPDPKDRQRTRIGQRSPEEVGWNGVAGHLQQLHKAKPTESRCTSESAAQFPGRTKVQPCSDRGVMGMGNGFNCLGPAYPVEPSSSEIDYSIWTGGEVGEQQGARNVVEVLRALHGNSWRESSENNDWAVNVTGIWPFEKEINTAFMAAVRFRCCVKLSWRSSDVRGERYCRVKDVTCRHKYKGPGEEGTVEREIEHWRGLRRMYLEQNILRNGGQRRILFGLFNDWPSSSMQEAKSHFCEVVQLQITRSQCTV
ncbi:hypothetical protein C8R45DRAFT_928561 [Mycena sanguinolenta]|nr:hypothetical protein C8R45DRAFT_928561 [Mycena sanguinolenta]